MKLELDPCDEWDFIQSATGTHAMVLDAEHQSTRDHKGLIDFFDGTKNLIKEADEQITQICLKLDDHGSLVNWADRMKSIQKQLDIVERNRPHIGTRLFDRDAVLASIAFLVAIRIGAQQTVALNAHKVEKSKFVGNSN